MDLMTKFFKDYLYKCVTMFIDDMLVFYMNGIEHEEHVRLFLEILHVHKIYAKFIKCHFWQIDVKFLGHVINRKVLVTDPNMEKYFSDWKKDENNTEIRSFLSIAGYYNRFIKKFSIIVDPLTKLMLKYVKFIWT